MKKQGNWLRSMVKSIYLLAINNNNNNSENNSNGKFGWVKTKVKYETYVDWKVQWECLNSVFLKA